MFVSQEDVAKFATASKSEMAADRREVVVDEAKSNRQTICDLIVGSERDSVTGAVIAMVLGEARHFDPVSIQPIVLPQRGEGCIRSPCRAEREKRAPQIELPVVTVGCVRVTEMRAQVWSDECRIVVRQQHLRAIDTFAPSELDVFAEAEEVVFAHRGAIRARPAAPSSLRLRRNRPRVLRDHSNVDHTVVRS